MERHGNHLGFAIIFKDHIVYQHKVGLQIHQKIGFSLWKHFLNFIKSQFILISLNREKFFCVFHRQTSLVLDFDFNRPRFFKFPFFFLKFIQKYWIYPLNYHHVFANHKWLNEFQRNDLQRLKILLKCFFKYFQTFISPLDKYERFVIFSSVSFYIDNYLRRQKHFEVLLFFRVRKNILNVTWRNMRVWIVIQYLIIHFCRKLLKINS
jgi:hypothetical protein